ncbi:CPBP family intramembrane glutamic endopeptidase [Pseudoxanthomonas sp.]|uniref:CPBP family intramembrane glutamic endopeptidase n=1 Tax=Pseudoxanthomonas sp. TaxID=1871049 RepID=UPI0025D81123|nr:CPBP family intramembrane glutamic endopeptidase [Pseudoxanthomonas sp.]
MHSPGLQHRPDFPFYAGRPVSLSGPQWLVVMASVALAFWLLVAPWTRPPQPWGMWIPVLLFCGVPLCALALVVGRAWTALFHRPSGRDLLLMVGIAALNLVVTLLIGLLLNGLDHGSANPAFKSMGEADTATRVMAFAAMVPQLLGEELLTILPLLALLWWLHTRMRLARRTALVLAWLLSAIPFALAHLPTYQWDLVQCLVIIGSARLVLSLAYLFSRNLWVSTGAHVLNDWTLFGAGLLLGSLSH